MKKSELRELIREELLNEEPSPLEIEGLIRTLDRFNAKTRNNKVKNQINLLIGYLTDMVQ